MPTTVFQVDAFTDTAFRGNPAAVVLLDAPADEAWMQPVAAEMNLSETAFVHPDGDRFALRWFTPTVEVDLCGHATLATAHVLWTEGHVPRETPLQFETRSGLLTCTASEDGEVCLDFPVDTPQPVTAPATLVAALGTTPLHIARGKFDYLVALDSAETVRALTPDLAALTSLGGRGVCVTARGAEGSAVDFVSRFFAPAVGIDEDPVTGSAHCMLAPYWSPRLGKSEMTAHQLSRRGGNLRVRLDGDRVLLYGRAVTVLRGSLL